MSTQRLSAKTLRKVTRHTGIENLKHGVANGGYYYILTTLDHRHFRYEMKTCAAVEVELDYHYTSCPGHMTDDGVWDLQEETA